MPKSTLTFELAQVAPVANLHGSLHLYYNQVGNELIQAAYQESRHLGGFLNLLSACLLSVLQWRFLILVGESHIDQKLQLLH